MAAQVYEDIFNREAAAIGRDNFIRSAGTNPDEEARLQAQAAELGMQVDDVRQLSTEEIEFKLAEHYAPGLDAYPPAVRRFMAVESKARLVGSNPKAFEDLTIPAKIMSLVGSGLTAGDMSSAGVDYADARARVEDPTRALYRGSDQTVSITAPKDARAEDSSERQRAKADLETATREVAAAAFDMMGYATPEAQQYISSAATVEEAFKRAAENPLYSIFGAGIQSMATQGWALPLTWASYALGPAVGASVQGSASYQTEFGSTLVNELAEAGVDILNPEALMAAAKDPELMRMAVEKADKRALSVGAFDAAAGALAPLVLKPFSGTVNAAKTVAGITGKSLPPSTLAAEAGGIKPFSRVTDFANRVEQLIKESDIPVYKPSVAARETENLVSQVALGGTLGAAGEATAQIASEGEITSPGDIIMEAAGEFFMAPVDVMMARNAIKRARQDEVKAQAAVRVADGIKATIDAAVKSEVAQRSPEVFKQYLDDAAKGQPMSHLSVDVQKLKDTGLDMKLAMVSPELADSILTASALGGDVDVTMGDMFMLARADEAAAKQLADIVRSDLAGMSLEEAKEFDATYGLGLAKAAQDIMDAAGNKLATADAWSKDMDAALTPLEGDIRRVYKNAKDADVLITATRVMVESMARSTGVMPSQLMSVLGNPLRLTDKSGRESGQGAGGLTMGFFSPDKATIHISKEGTAATYMHELSHFWLESFSVGLSSGKLNLVKPEYEAHWNNMLTWLGAKGNTVQEKFADFASDSKRKNAMHEKFAEGFESYMKTGRAPAEGLEHVFRAFKDFMKKLVTKFPGIVRKDLSDDVKEMYDGIFFSDYTAAEAVGNAGWVSGEMDAFMQANLTPEEYTAYRESFTRTIDETAAELNASQDRNRRRINLARERAKKGINKLYNVMVKDAKDEILGQRAFQTLDVLKSGKSIRQDGLKIKMDKDSAKLMLPEHLYKEASKRGWVITQDPQAVASGKDKRVVADPLTLAQMLGYSDAESMLNDAVSAAQVDVDKQAKDIADARFLAKYGENSTEAGQQRLASNAVYNRSRLLVLATELRALKKLKGGVQSIVRASRAFAKSAIKTEKAFDIKTTKYQNAAKRARIQRDRALAHGDIDRAAEYTRGELMNAAMAREIGDFVKARDRFLKDVPRMAASKSMDFDFRDQVRGLAVATGMMTAEEARVNPNAPSLYDFLNSDPNDPYLQYLKSVAPAFLMASKPGFVKTMTVEQFQQLDAFMRQLATAGRKVGKLNREGQRAAEIQARLDLSNELEKNAKDRGRVERAVGTETRPWLRRKEMVVGYFQDHIKMQTWFRIFDGNKFGKWFELLGKKANECADSERVWLKEVNEKLYRITDPLIKKGLHKNDVEIGGVKYTLGQRLVMALNMGNEGNKKRLMEGHGLTEDQLNQVIASLTPDELAAVQAIWDIFESFKPKIDAMHRRLYGETLDWVQPTPITVTYPDGSQVDLRGGYYPIRYDSSSAKGHASSQIARMEQEAKAALAGGFTGTGTSRMYSKARADEGLGIPLRLDIQPLFDGVAEVIHDVSWREFLLHANRLGTTTHVKNPDGSVTEIDGITATMAKYYGPNVAKQYKEWLENIATNGARPNQTMDRAASYIRRGVSISGLGFNVISAAVQITGLIPAMTRIGVQGTTAAVLEYTANMPTASADIAAKSDFMKVRTDTFLRELDDISNRVQRGTTRTGRALLKTQEAAYFMMAFVQSHIDRIVWLGAYRKYVTEGLSEQEAVARADQTVRDTQGSGLIADQASAEMGSVAKLFTAFYSFMNTAYNLNAAALLGEKNRFKAAADIVTISVILPVVEGFLRAALQPGDDEDKEWQDYVAKAAGDITSFNMGLIVGIREAASISGNFVAGEPIFTWRGPSSLRIFADFGQFLSQVDQGEFDLALLKSIINLTGVTLGLPAAQGVKFVDGFDALVNERQTDNPLVLLTGYKEK